MPFNCCLAPSLLARLMGQDYPSRAAQTRLAVCPRNRNIKTKAVSRGNNGPQRFAWRKKVREPFRGVAPSSRSFTIFQGEHLRWRAFQYLALQRSLPSRTVHWNWRRETSSRSARSLSLSLSLSLPNVFVKNEKWRTSRNKTGRREAPDAD